MVRSWTKKDFLRKYRIGHLKEEEDPKEAEGKLQIKNVLSLQNSTCKKRKYLRKAEHKNKVLCKKDGKPKHIKRMLKMGRSKRSLGREETPPTRWVKVVALVKMSNIGIRFSICNSIEICARQINCGKVFNNLSHVATKRDRPVRNQRGRSLKQVLIEQTVSPIYSTPHEYGMQDVLLDNK